MLASIRDQLKRPWVPYFIISLFALLAQGLLLLLNDGIYWDAWLILPEVISQNLTPMYETFRDAGSPWHVYDNGLMGVFPDAHMAYRWFALSSILLFGNLVFAILEETRLATRIERLCIALFCVSYPAFQILLSHGTVFFVGVPNACLFLGTFLALKSENASARGHYVLRVLALLFIALSFLGIQFFIPFYYGLFFLQLLRIQQQQQCTLRQLIVQYLPRRLDYVIMPCVVWFVRSHYFPQQGVFANQYALRTSPLSVARAAVIFLRTLAGQFYRVFAHALQSPLFWVLLLGTIVCIRWAWSSGGRSSDKPPERSRLVLIFGLQLFLLGVFPFAATGRVPTLPQGWGIRYLILMPLPIGVLFCAIIRSICADNLDRWKKIAPIAWAILVLAFMSSTFDDYVTWQARWAKDRSLMVHLTKLDDARAYSVFWIDDQFPQVEGEYYRFYEYASMLKTIWGDESHLGVEKGDKSSYSPEFLAKGQRFFTPHYHLRTLDPAGCQATLVLRPGSQRQGSFELAMRYLYDRFFQPNKLDEFLLSVTDVQVQPQASPLATHCQRAGLGAKGAEGGPKP